MENILCTVEQGTLKGQAEKNIFGGLFYSFVGVPYAKPPLGKLRFKNPQPPESWTGIRDATKQGNPCHGLQLVPTPEALTLKPIGSEDCLFLNVYTRQLSNDTQNELKPVMMFIHGGAFTMGSSDRSMYGPELLMTEDVVLVTINYRLGALGFLVIDDPSLGVTGNVGLKDQVQALKWIQKNIKQFGGDPNNVTIFGESAGGASVHYLVLSPLAKGLFHKAIIQSASALCPWARGINNAKKLAEILGFTGNDNLKILDFLQQVSVEKLIEGQIKLGDWLSPHKKRNFAPTIEPEVDNAFITEEPIRLINSGNYNKVPLMFGYTSLEGLFDEGNKLLGFQSNLETFVPYYFDFEDKNEQIYQDTNKKIVKYYYGNEIVDPENKNALYLVLTDTMFLRGIHLALMAHVKTCENPIYYYRMSVDTELNFIKKMVLNVATDGVCHGDDLGYLFKNSGTAFQPDSVEEISVRRFVKMWRNFAHTGKPVPVRDSLLDTEWKPVTVQELNFLDIGTELIPGINPDLDRMHFWDEISKGVKEVY